MLNLWPHLPRPGVGMRCYEIGLAGGSVLGSAVDIALRIKVT